MDLRTKLCNGLELNDFGDISVHGTNFYFADLLGKSLKKFNFNFGRIAEITEITSFHRVTFR